MNILLTGIGGYIGSIVTDELIAQGHKVIGIDNFSKGHKQAINKNVKYYNYGLNDNLNSLFRNHFDAVIHLAAKTNVSESMTNPNDYFQNNVIGGLNLLNYMREFGVNKIIFSSSASVYGYAGDNPLKETAELNPINPYGESKSMFERILEWYGKAYGIKYISFRYFNVAGATELRGQDQKPETMLIPCIFKAIQDNELIKVYGMDYPTKDGTCVRDYVHVSDVAKAHILALDKIEEFSHNTYNLSSVAGFSNLDVINSVSRVIGRHLKLQEFPHREGDPPILIADSNLARKELGWNPEYTNIDSIVRSAWEWHWKFPQGYED